jgi:hypothetical protein
MKQALQIWENMMTKLWQPTRREVLAGTAAGVAACGLAPWSRALAQEFPSRTIEVVVPTREGGGADRNLRAVTGVWKKYLNDATFEAVFYPGASGRVGYEVYMGKIEPDPHNLLFGNMGPEVLNWVVEPPENGIRLNLAPVASPSASTPSDAGCASRLVATLGVRFLPSATTSSMVWNGPSART